MATDFQKAVGVSSQSEALALSESFNNKRYVLLRVPKSLKVKDLQVVLPNSKDAKDRTKVSVGSSTCIIENTTDIFRPSAFVPCGGDSVKFVELDATYQVSFDYSEVDDDMGTRIKEEMEQLRIDVASIRESRNRYLDTLTIRPRPATDQKTESKAHVELSPTVPEIPTGIAKPKKRSRTKEKETTDDSKKRKKKSERNK